METKKTTKVATPKSKTAKNGVVKKRISKIMKAAEKYKGAFDMDEVLSYVNSKY